MSILASDNFDRANENPLGNGVWSTGSGATAMRIVGNVATPTDISTTDDVSYYSGISWPADQFSRAKLTVSSTLGGNRGPGVVVRQSSSANTHYRLTADHGATNNVVVAKVVAGVFTALSGFPLTLAWNDGDTWELRVKGSQVSAFRNGVQVGSTATDTAITSGSPGIVVSVDVTSASIDDWEGGDVVTPVGFGGTRRAFGGRGRVRSINTPSGPFDRLGFLKQRVWDYTLIAAAALVAAPLAALWSWVAPDPSVTLGNVTAQPSAAVTTWIAPVPSISVGGVTANPTAVAWNWNALPPSVTEGPTNVSPVVARADWIANDGAVSVGGTSGAPVSAETDWIALSGSPQLGSVSAAVNAAPHLWTALDASVTSGPPPGDTANPASAVTTWSAPDATTATGDVQVVPSNAVSNWVVPDAAFGEVAEAPSVGDGGGVPSYVPRQTRQPKRAPQYAQAQASSLRWIVPQVNPVLGLVNLAIESVSSYWVVRDAIPIQRFNDDEAEQALLAILIGRELL